MRFVLPVVGLATLVDLGRREVTGPEVFPRSRRYRLRLSGRSSFTSCVNKIAQGNCQQTKFVNTDPQLSDHTPQATGSPKRHSSSSSSVRGQLACPVVGNPGK